MHIERRSFRIGLIAGGFLVAGLVIGVLLTARYGMVNPVESAAPAAVSAPLPDGESPKNFAGVVKAVMPAVVNISTSRVVKTPQAPEGMPFGGDEEFFRRFFGDEFFRRFHAPRNRRENSLGSGVIVSNDGYIITNNHVIAKADEIKVLLSDKREFTGKVVGTDPKTDIAVIKIDGKDLPTIPWGNSDKLDIGEYVLAIGNPFGLNQTVTLGIVSAVGRANVGIADYEDFIQTDAAINPGNSGGALVNARGELVGINTAIFSRSGGYMGIGFAVPSNMTRSVMDSLVKDGKVVRGWLGVSIQEVNADIAKQFGIKESRGALVAEVLPDSPAAKAGFKSYDVITKFNGKDIDSPSVLRNAVAQTPVGTKVNVEVIRDKEKKTLSVKIAEQPKDMVAGDGDGDGDIAGEKTDTALAGLQIRNLSPDIVRQLDLPANTTGVIVSDVNPESAAAEAGVIQGDVILEINRARVKSISDFQRINNKLGKKDSALLRINRRGSKLVILVKP